MSTEKTLRIDSTSLDDTLRIAEAVGRQLRGGETLEFISDLGGGKTTFMRGLVKGTGSSDNVASPTFTISREYQANDFVIRHFDLYRLNEAGIIADELAEYLQDPGVVTAIEWGDVAHDVLPSERLIITIQVTGDDSRLITFAYPQKLSYLVDEL